MTDILNLSATELVARLARRQLRPREVVEAFLDAIEARDADLKAFVHLDRDAAVRAADTLEASSVQGPLHGLPIAVKDVLDTCDMPAQYGSPIWTGFRPRSDAVTVALARRAGAVVVGKTATTEFATRFPPPTVNPVNPGHTPGGSSSGSAAAVASYLIPAAFGTQTAGSIIRPAAFCGIVGYKPTFGTLHRGGMKIMSENLDTIGVLARSVHDCALFAGSLTSRSLVDIDDKPRLAPRIALILDLPAALTPAMLGRLDDVASKLARAGAIVARVALPRSLNALYDLHPVVMDAEIARALSWEADNCPEQLSAVLRQVIARGRSTTPERVDDALGAFETARSAFADFMANHDFVLTASALGEAPAGLESTGDPICCIVWTALHVPCVNVPAGCGPNGLPLGVQVVGRQGGDRAVLAWARWVEAQLA